MSDPFLQGPKLADTAEIHAALEMLGAGDGSIFSWNGSGFYSGTGTYLVSRQYFYQSTNKTS